MVADGKTLLIASAGGAAALYGIIWTASRLSPAFDLHFHLWRTLGRCALGRTLAVVSAPARALLPLPPLPGDAAVSTQWITQLLRRKGLLEPGTVVSEARLETWTGEAFGGGHGSTCRVVLTYTGLGSVGKPPPATHHHSANPATLVLKRSSEVLLRGWAAIASGQQREVLFHRRFGIELDEILDAPLFSSVQLGGFFLLTPEVEGTPLHRYMGAQLEFFGMLSSQTLGSLTAVDALREAFQAAAVLHASHWNDGALKRLRWLKGSAWYEGRDRGSWEQGMELSFRAWENLKRLHNEGSLGFELSAKLARVIDASFARSTWDSFQASIQHPDHPFALIHGDFHAQNMMLRAACKNAGRKGGAALSVFDWSEVGPGCPMTDLGQMMISDVPREVWKSHGLDLVKDYWNALLARGVDEYSFPFDRCWALFETAGVQKWIWLFPIMAKFVPPHTLVFFQRQLEAFIADHGDYDSYQIHSSMLLLL